MNQVEWTALTGHVALDGSKDWADITVVYTHHPLIPDVGGKAKIQQIFKLGGMGLIRSMVKDAETAMEMQDAIYAQKSRIADLESELLKAHEEQTRFVETADRLKRTFDPAS